MPTRYATTTSPLGPILLARDGDGLCSVSFLKGKHPVQPEPEWVEDEAALAEAIEQFTDYFAGRRKDFDLVLSVHGTSFQRSVWTTLRTIPFGETTSYGEVARTLGRPKATRAVGAANSRNPLPIVIPCHRVVGHDGSLTGFNGGVGLKRELLAHERRHGGRGGIQMRLL